MNNQRRKELAKALELLEEAKSIVEAMREEEQDTFDNMPENLQQSERAERLEENVTSLDNAVDQIEEAIQEISSASE